MRTESRWILEEWLTAPTFTFWPPQRHNAVVWILANMIYYVTMTNRAVSLQDYLDYLHRTRWKAYHVTGRMQKVGNYLDAL
jgi:hypothetical protein